MLCPPHLLLHVGIGELFGAAHDCRAATVACRHMPVNQPSRCVVHAFHWFPLLAIAARRRPRQGRTYSKSTGLAWIPALGGAIHDAMRPGSWTGCISDATNSKSLSVGSHSVRFASHSCSLTTSP